MKMGKIRAFKQESSRPSNCVLPFGDLVTKDVIQVPNQESNREGECARTKHSDDYGPRFIRYALDRLGKLEDMYRAEQVCKHDDGEHSLMKDRVAIQSADKEEQSTTCLGDDRV